MKIITQNMSNDATELINNLSKKHERLNHSNLKIELNERAAPQLAHYKQNFSHFFTKWFSEDERMITCCIIAYMVSE